MATSVLGWSNPFATARYMNMNYKIDAIDRDLIQDYKWCISDGYIVANGGKYVGNSLHRVIAERVGLDLSNHIDHEDGNKLNNHRYNLRPATYSQNLANSKRRSDNTSGFKGVGFYKNYQKWTARIRVKGKSIHLGYFNSPKEAHKAYCEAAIKYFGKFANSG